MSMHIHPWIGMIQGRRYNLSSRKLLPCSGKDDAGVVDGPKKNPLQKPRDKMYGDGDYGIVLRPGEGEWKLLDRHTTPYPMLRDALGITTSPNVFTPAQQYECPSHIGRMLQDHDDLREVQKTLSLLEDIHDHQVLEWKPEALIKSCLAAERLNFEGRSSGSPLLPKPDFARLPRPLRYAKGSDVYAGFQHKEQNCYVQFDIHNGIFFGERLWNIGLAVYYTEPEQVRWDIKHCACGMRVSQLARKEREGEQNVDMYGLVTSGDIMQFHKLNDNGELQSSPVLLIASDGPECPGGKGLVLAWSYLREIIHVIQQKARPPSPDKPGPFRDARIFELERMIMRSRWRLTPDGNPIEGPRSERSKREAMYLRGAARDPGDPELQCEDESEDESEEDEDSNPRLRDSEPSDDFADIRKGKLVDDYLLV
ncbi:uncharacterized protein BJX67DRAFT_352715 [Aspergillus lucknowensis]|uniref:Uncharacterized protein n=1 Tax=Aspergillus lucknowensis TaxID=176173 RepID=A0ABR4LSW9_9EURO